jgi:hypothetical protein
VAASGATLDGIAIEIVQGGATFGADGLGCSAIEPVGGKRDVAFGTLLRRRRLRDIVDKSQRGVERGDFDDRGRRRRLGRWSSGVLE